MSPASRMRQSTMDSRLLFLRSAPRSQPFCFYLFLLCLTSGVCTASPHTSSASVEKSAPTPAMVPSPRGAEKVFPAEHSHRGTSIGYRSPIFGCKGMLSAHRPDAISVLRQLDPVNQSTPRHELRHRLPAKQTHPLSSGKEENAPHRSFIPPSSCPSQKEDHVVSPFQRSLY